MRALAGLYGVMAYSVTRRYRELGIRIAMGASPRRVLTMVLRESALLGVCRYLLRCSFRNLGGNVYPLGALRGAAE
jgi:ABC-type lipoprotein release transport system permease subunit